MDGKKLLVLGGGAAGMAAASKAKRTDKSLDVTVLEAKGHVSHAPCGTPYFLGGDFDDPDLLVHYPVEYFEKKRGIKIKLWTPAKKIDFDGQKVIAINKDGDEEEYEYDYLVLAMGAKPRRLNVEGENLGNIYHLRHIDDVIPIKKLIPKIENVVIVGAGFIGVEMAEAFIRNKKKVTMITRGSRVLSRLDPELSEPVEKAMMDAGVKIIKNAKVEAFEGEDKVKKVITDKDEFPADLVIVAIGTKPNVDLLEGTKIKLGYKNTVRVNSKMETNIEGVYAAGDIAEMWNIVTGLPTWYPLAQIANKMGRVAGSNIGGVTMHFRGVAGTTFTKFMDTAIGVTGLNSVEAEKSGFNVKSVVIDARDKPHYYPGSRPIRLKLIYDLNSRLLLGGQAVGGFGVAGRINVIATALYARFKVDDLFYVDLGYAPPFAPVWDPIVVASSVSMRDLQKKKKV